MNILFTFSQKIFSSSALSISACKHRVCLCLKEFVKKMFLLISRACAHLGKIFFKIPVLKKPPMPSCNFPSCLISLFDQPQLFTIAPFQVPTEYYQNTIHLTERIKDQYRPQDITKNIRDEISIVMNRLQSLYVPTMHAACVLYDPAFKNTKPGTDFAINLRSAINGLLGRQPVGFIPIKDIVRMVLFEFAPILLRQNHQISVPFNQKDSNLLVTNAKRLLDMSTPEISCVLVELMEICLFFGSMNISEETRRQLRTQAALKNHFSHVVKNLLRIKLEKTLVEPSSVSDQMLIVIIESCGDFYVQNFPQ